MLGLFTATGLLFSNEALPEMVFVIMFLNTIIQKLTYRACTTGTLC